MSRRLLGLLWIAAATVAVAVLLNLVPAPVSGQAPPPPATRPKAGPRPRPRGARPTCRASGPTPTRSRCSGPPRYAQQGVLHRRRAWPSWTSSARRILSQDIRRYETGQRAGRRRRLQHHHLPVAQADRPADVAHRRSAGRPHSSVDARGDEAEGGHARVPARPAAGDRGLQEQAARLRGREVRAAVAATQRGAAVLPGDRAPRAAAPSTAPTARRTGRSASGAWRPCCPILAAPRASSPDHPVARRRLDLLRHGPGPGLAAHHSHHRPPASAVDTSGNGGATRAAAGKATRWSST